MKIIVVLLMTMSLMIILTPTITFVRGTNESSFQRGFCQGSLTGPQFAPGSNWNPSDTCGPSPSFTLDNPKVVIPAVTNTTACQDGFYNGYKDWCSNHAVNCVGNITIGNFPDMIVKAHQEYLRGYNTANGSGNAMCPIGNNAAFCHGWNSNNGDYGESDCGDAYVNYTGPFSNGLIGCPLDTLKASQMAALPMLVGNWDFVNETNRPDISGTMKFGANGDVNMTVPSKTAFGDYRLETSWGYIGHNILTQCMPSGGCENSTLTTITPNHIEFTDNHGDRIHLIRDMALKTNSSQLAPSPYQSGYQHGAKTIYGLGNFMTKEGFGNHTEKFNQGYIDGFCMIEGKGAGSDADQGTFECADDSTHFKGK